MIPFEEKLEQIFKHFNITSSQFADTIGTQKSSISHLLSGRNKPSLDFISKVYNAYPSLNLHWLIFDKEPFLASNVNENNVSNELTYEAEKISQEQTLETKNEHLDSKKNEEIVETDINENSLENEITFTKDSIQENQKIKSNNEKQIKSVMIFYTDGTFENFISNS